MQYSTRMAWQENRKTQNGFENTIIYYVKKSIDKNVNKVLRYFLSCISTYMRPINPGREVSKGRIFVCEKYDPVRAKTTEKSMLQG